MMKRVLIIGASSAMAQATAKILGEAGVYVIGISRSDITSVYNEVYQVTSYTDGLPVFDGPLDGLLYFPGTINLKPFHRLSIDDFKTELDIHVFGAINCIQHYLPQLKQADQSAVVLMSSVAATTGMTFHASVSLVKGALESLTRSLAAEYAPKIRFNAVAPSLTQTPMADRLTATEEKIQQAGERHPLKRIGQPEDLAQTIAFLVSEQASWITGQVLHVDGGMGVLK